MTSPVDLHRGDTRTLYISGPMAAGGDAITRLADGRVTFVEGALPGETVDAEVVEVRRDFARTRVRTVKVASPVRVEAPCPHVPRGCGGCPWQYIMPSAQLSLKQSVVTDALSRIGRVDHDVEWLPARALPDRAYRTTVRVAVGADGRPAYHRPHSKALVEVDSCMVAHDRLSELLVAIRAEGVDQLTLRVGVAGGERLAVIDSGRPVRLEVPEDVTVVREGQQAWIHEQVAGRRWRIGARSFFQAGPLGAEALAEAVDEAVGDAIVDGGLLVDAYAGVGLLGGVVAGRRGARLLALEQHPDAVADAGVNLADLEATVAIGEVGDWEAIAAGAIIADPARPGLGRPGVAALSAAGADRLVLVSCDPASLGRDVRLLTIAGYRLASLRVVDLFPHTAHIETVARFDRA